jgi:hypothetical protein
MTEFFSRERHIYLPGTYTVEDIFNHIEANEDTLEYTSCNLGEPAGGQIGIIHFVFGDNEQDIEVCIYESNHLVVDGETYGEDYTDWSPASIRAFESVVNCLYELQG